MSMKTESILLKNANVFDGKKDSKLKKGVDILIVGNKIDKIGKNIDPKEANTVIDCSDKYVIPGLINLHVHLPANGKAPFKNSSSKKLAKLLLKYKPLHKLGIAIGGKYCKQDLSSGVTSLRAVGGVGNFDSILRDKINDGKAVGPRLFVANSAVGVPDGHMDGTVAVACNSPEECAEMVRKLANEKVDLIKLMITGGVLDAVKPGEPGVLKMPKEYIKAACDEAHKLGLKVASHAEGDEGVRLAIENGVDTIEHGALIPDDLAEIMKARNGALVVTLSPAIPLAYFDEQTSGGDDICQLNSYAVVSKMVAGARSAMKHDVMVGLGTDTGSAFVTHYNFYRELVFFKNIFKVSNEYAIHTATLLNAKIMQKDDVLGSIEVGKYADMAIFDNNPLENLNNLKTPYKVIKDGRLVKDMKIKKNKYLDDCLDRLMDIDLEKALNEKFKGRLN